jgi:hypothetical protein
MAVIVKTLSNDARLRCYWTRGQKKGNDQAAKIVECRDLVE